MKNGQSFYVLAPNGVVHKVPTDTIQQARSIQAFGELLDVHGHEVQNQTTVHRAASVRYSIENKLDRTVLDTQTPLPIQYMFLDATGEVVDHPDVHHFFQAVGFDSDMKKKMKANQRRIDVATQSDLWADISAFKISLGS